MPVPTEAEALSVLAELRRTIDPETSKPFDAENSRADPAYIRAALAVQRSHPKAQKSNGEPNYAGAARMCIDDPEKVHASVSRLVRRWVAKLERLEHVRRQSTLFTELGQMEDRDSGQMAPEELLSLLARLRLRGVILGRRSPRGAPQQQRPRHARSSSWATTR